MGGQRLPTDSLSEREKRIVGLLIDGWNNKEIASQLGMTETNVAVVMSRARDRLRALSTEHFIAILFRKGILK